MSESGRIVATYEVQARRDEVADLARRIAYEQTVEVPPSLVTDPVVRDRVLGRVETVSSLESTVPEPVGSHSSDASHRVTISYAGELASGQLPQLLNLLYGNVSIYPSVRLVDFTLPPPVASAFAGPRFGIEGLRRLTGVRGRPLLATALKPRGLPVAEYARLAGGFALGGGLELAMACTFRLASPGARMGLPEIKLGLVPGYGGTQRLPRLVGEANALDIVMTGRMVGADEGRSMGLVNRIVEGDPIEAGLAFAAELAGYSLPVLRLARDAVRRALDLPVREGLEVEADAGALSYQTADAAEGMNAFVEKRAPAFRDA